MSAIYHYPRFSKSRQTFALLEEQGVVPEVVEYLKEPMEADTLRGLVAKLGGARPMVLCVVKRRSMLKRA